MRTTIDIDEDVLLAAREMAAREGRTAGQVLSDLARRGIQLVGTPERASTSRNGFEVIPACGRIVTAELVSRLLDETKGA